MRLEETKIPGVWMLESKFFGDHRGIFSRLFCAEELKDILGHRTILQINHSLSRNTGTIRGMHYQRQPHAEMKIVRCLQGSVLDIAVDLRRGSPTFLQWASLELSAKNYHAFVIPEGCAHGFQVLEDDTELLYLHTALYTPAAEGAVRFDDPKLNITWPLAPTDISARDLKHELLSDDFKGIA